MPSTHAAISRFVGASCAVLALFGSQSALAQLPVIQPTQHLRPPPDPAPGGNPGAQVRFGWAAATDGATASITVDHGRAAYAYRKNANGRWVYQSALAAPAGGYTSYGAALHGDTALVHGSLNSQGAVFVFHRAQGVSTQTQTLPADPAVAWVTQQIALTDSYAAI